MSILGDSKLDKTPDQHVRDDSAESVDGVGSPESLRASEQTYRVLFQQSTDATLIIVDGRFSVNGGASSIGRGAWKGYGYGRKTRVSKEAALFENPAKGDYELAEKSVARDTGKKLKEVKRDLDRRRRVRTYDIGALETSRPGG